MIVRFIGDPTGYTVCEPSKAKLGFTRWIEAFVGRTSRRVWIDLSKAYLIESPASA